MAALALLALAACAHSQVLDTRVLSDGSTDTQNINKFVPQTTLYTSNGTADVGITPATPVRLALCCGSIVLRRLSGKEAVQGSRSQLHFSGYQVLASHAVSASPVALK